MESIEATCLNCGTPLHGKFCSACGQKVIEPEERTIKHFVYQFFGYAFFLENNFAKNLWILLTRPGRLSIDFIEGRRKRWMPPLSLFLLINLFYFWFSPLTDLNLKMKDQLKQPHHKGWVNNLVKRRMESEQITLEQYAEKYNQKSTGYSNSLVILHIPIFAGFLSLIYFRNKYYYVDHIIYAIYFLSFILLVSLLQVGLIYILVNIFETYQEVIWKTVGLLYLGAILTYTFYSLRRTYYQKSWQVALTMVPVFTAFIISHLLYRTILFLIIFAVT